MRGLFVEQNVLPIPASTAKRSSPHPKETIPLYASALLLHSDSCNDIFRKTYIFPRRSLSNFDDTASNHNIHGINYIVLVDTS